MDKELIGSVGIDGISVIWRQENFDLNEEQKYYSETPSLASTYLHNREPSYSQKDNPWHLEVSMSTQNNDEAFSVADPVIGSHVSYSVKGIDNDGAFEGLRRYNDFFNLR